MLARPLTLLGLLLLSCRSEPAAPTDAAPPSERLTFPDAIVRDASPDLASCSGAADVFASPSGSGSACSCALPCALEAARDRARSLAPSLTRDLVVQLAGGTYTLAAPFVLGAADSGQGGHAIIYRAAPSEVPVLSGGIRVSGFQPGAGGVHTAKLPPGTRSRQLYVGERRATRARGGDGPPGFAKQAGGFALGDPTIASWPDRLGLEVVGQKEWKSFRCGVSAVSAAGLALVEPCWSASQAQTGVTLDSVAWLENARALLDQPGEFFLDEQAGTLAYRPLPDEDLGTAVVVVPVLEALLRVEGTPAAPVHDLAFEGLTFAHATWLGPSSADGYASLQAGVTRRGSAGTATKPPANVTLRAAQRVRFSGCRFAHLGAVALTLEAGARENTIERCRFEDISGSAVFVGDVTHTEDHHPSDPALVVRDNTVRGCYVTRVGVEYLDMVALFAGYTTRTTFAQNEIFDVPYTGISLGWGWGSVDPGGSAGYLTPTPSQGNVVSQNLISHHLRRLRDGGGIYVLGAQPGSVMKENVIADQGSQYGNLYLDNGSSGWTVSGNLVLVPAKEAGTDVERSYWLYVQVYPPIATSNVVGLNYTNDPLLFTPQPIDPSNQVQTPGAASAAPASLRAGAGSPLRSPNLAVGKPVTASSVYDSAHPAALAVNENAYDGWSPAGDDQAAYLQVDLGGLHAIDAIEVVSRWGYDQPVTRRSYRVRAAKTADLAGAVVLAEVGSTPLAHRAIFARELATVVARHVRFEKTAPEYFFLAEVRIHGTPAK
jgi:hypothetical protein